MTLQGRGGTVTIAATNSHRGSSGDASRHRHRAQQCRGHGRGHSQRALCSALPGHRIESGTHLLAAPAARVCKSCRASHTGRRAAARPPRQQPPGAAHEQRHPDGMHAAAGECVVARSHSVCSQRHGVPKKHNPQEHNPARETLPSDAAPSRGPKMAANLKSTSNSNDTQWRPGTARSAHRHPLVTNDARRCERQQPLHMLVKPMHAYHCPMHYTQADCLCHINLCLYTISHTSEIAKNLTQPATQLHRRQCAPARTLDMHMRYSAPITGEEKPSRVA